MKKTILTLVVLIGISLVISGCGSEQNSDISDTQNDGLMSTINQEADKIEIVHFHATRQCWSCKTVGKYALKTIQEKFPEEYQSGEIVFKDINVELPENRDIVMKYRARGSSLFVNAITGNQDNIEEDIRVWRLIVNETQFINYFENKLKNLLGK